MGEQLGTSEDNRGSGGGKAANLREREDDWVFHICGHNKESDAWTEPF